MSRLDLMLAIQRARVAGLIYFAAALEELLRRELRVPAQVSVSPMPGSGRAPVSG